ncbi:MAG: cytochrome P450 [Luteolibacter sp.]
MSDPKCPVEKNHEMPSFTGKPVDAAPFSHTWMVAKNPALFIQSLVRDHGDFVRYKGLLDFHLVNHPALVRAVLKNTHRDFDKNSRIYNHFRNVFGNGLVTAEGDAWKRKRKLMQPVFTPASSLKFFPGMLEAAKNTVASWNKFAGESLTFDMAEEMNHLTLEIAGRSFFGDGFDNSAKRIRAWTEAINRYSAKPPLPIVSHLRFPSPTNLLVRKMMKDFRDFMRGLIHDRVNAPPQDDLLGILLSTETMDEAEICEEILGMIVGGHETAATALTWFWYELHHHPKIEQKVVAEIAAVIGDSPLTPEKLCELTYTDRVMNETMRLHPPFWFENRNTMQDIELGGVKIPKGTMVAFSRYSLHRHPDYWENPDAFDPSRFDPEKPGNPGASCAYVPFGGGPRICIGRHFAMMELLVIAVTVLQRYHVIVDSSDRHQMAAKLTMAPKHGLIVTLKKRE